MGTVFTEALLDLLDVGGSEQGSRSWSPDEVLELVDGLVSQHVTSELEQLVTVLDGVDPLGRPSGDKSSGRIPGDVGHSCELFSLQQLDLGLLGDLLILELGVPELQLTSGLGNGGGDDVSALWRPVEGVGVLLLHLTQGLKLVGLTLTGDFLAVESDVVLGNGGVVVTIV